MNDDSFKEISDTIVRIKSDRLMLEVQRFAGTRMEGKENLASHGALTASLYGELMKLVHFNPTAEQILWIIRHDIPEVVTGDMLWPVKKKIGAQWDRLEGEIIEDWSPFLTPYTETAGKQLFTKSEWALFKISDYLEGWTNMQDRKYSMDQYHVDHIHLNYTRGILQVLDEIGIFSLGIKLTLKDFINHYVKIFSGNQSWK